MYVFFFFFNLFLCIFYFFFIVFIVVIIQVSIGKRHCACCNVEGKVWMWGNNRQQQSPVLGTRDRSPILWIPHLALFPCHRVETPRVLRVYVIFLLFFFKMD